MSPNSEIVNVKLRLLKAKPILIVTIYSHPATPTAKLVDFFRELNIYLSSFELDYYILGDFNVDLAKRDANSYPLFNVVKDFRLRQHMVGLTHKGLSLLDHVYSGSNNNVRLSGHFPFTSSDHDLTYLIHKTCRFNYEPKFINYRCYKNCDFE